jgi:3-oxoacyl-[acyl-carrier-protein] synthase I
MSDQPRLYIAGMGMITPVGINTAMTAAAVKAGVSAYEASDNFSYRAEPLTMSRVPQEVFDQIDVVLDEGGYNNHIIKMAILAMREALSGHNIKKPVPLLLVVPETRPDNTYIEQETLVKHLLKQKELPLHAGLIRYFASGRAGGIQALEYAQHYLYHQRADYVLVGGSDSHWIYPRLGELDLANRLLSPGNMDGFAAGEGAGFLLLTRYPQLALARGNYVVALSPAGVCNESGHLYSKEPYRGNGLDEAFKRALADAPENSVRAIYSSMNGEYHWAKEYGVAYTRNKDYFHDPVRVEHPADCFGDLGAATAPVLIGLAAEALFKLSGATTHLVYSSSDGPVRAAVRVEKLPRAPSAVA